MPRERWRGLDAGRSQWEEKDGCQGVTAKLPWAIFSHLIVCAPGGCALPERDRAVSVFGPGSLNFFQRAAFGFRDDEPDENAPQQAHSGE